MTSYTRRDALILGASAVALGSFWNRDVLAQLPIKDVPAPDFKIERGASLRLMRPSKFIQPDEDIWKANTAKFTQKTGVEVKIDWESWEDIRPKMAVAASIGSGPDIVMGWYDDPHQYPDKVIPLDDVAKYLGEKNGGWYPTPTKYCIRDGRWLAVPVGVGGGAMTFRTSWLKRAGYEKFPTDFPGMLAMAKKLKELGKPGGLALGNAVGDGNTWHWILWGFGAAVVDEKNRVILDSPETVAALEYARELYQTFIPGTLAWLDPSNNKAFLADEISWTHNGISIYFVAKNSKDPKVQAIAEDMDHAVPPIGPSGKPTATAAVVSAFVFKHCKYPNAAKAYITHMLEAEQYGAWQTGCIGYWQPSMKVFEQLPFWDADPKLTPFKYIPANLQYYGWRGTLGYASAATLADYVVVEMFANAASGKMSPKDAAKAAARRAERYYRERA